jgi:small subunit ribosomal protein S8
MMTDPIADLLTRIRNAQMKGSQTVAVTKSKVSLSILEVLKAEGFIADFKERAPLAGDERKLAEKSTSPSRRAFSRFGAFDVVLKYYPNGDPVIGTARRMSRPGRRMYLRNGSLPRVSNGLGVSLVATSSGMMSDRVARSKGIGGELVAIIA